MNVQMNSLGVIEKLDELKELGLITEEEFQEKKALVLLKEKQETLAATNEVRSRHKSRKRQEVESEESIKKPSASKNSYKQKKRRKIETLEGTTAPASNPDKRKKGYSSVLFVGLGILVVVCLGAVLWLLLS